MIKWTSIPFFRFAFAFMAGILFYIHNSFTVIYLLLFIFSTLSYILLYFISRKKRLFHTLKPFTGFAGMLTLFFFGTLYSQLRDEKNDPQHLLHLKEKVLYYQATVLDNSEEKKNTFRTKLRLDKIKSSEGWSNAEGKIIIYTPKENSNRFNYGDRLLIKGTPELTMAPANPFEYDYKNYLRFQGIHHTNFIKTHKLLFLENIPPSTFIASAIFVREGANKILREYIQGENEYKIASALILGIRSSLDNELKNAYSSTGTMHVLAVSGLHVAIILGMLMIFLRFLKLYPYGRIFLPILLIASLWIYAFITGFSASVLRAVVMFTIIIIAQSLKRNTNIYNTLAFSAFVLLCIDPFFLMDAGFQLSFLAVWGIIYFQPKIYPLLSFKNYLVDKLWIMTSVSIAAQLSTFPLTVYYFHQFPVNFILSNLIAIPVSFAILYSGMALLLFSWIPGLTTFLGYITEKGIWFMNYCIFMIEKIPFMNLKGIDIDLPEVIAIYLLIAFSSVFIAYKKLKHLIMATLILFCLSAIQIFEVLRQKNQQTFISFSISKHKAFGLLKGNQATILADSALLSDKQKQEYHIYPYLMQHGIKEINFTNIQSAKNSYSTDSLSLIYFQEKTFLIEHQPLKNISDIETDYVIHSGIRNVKATEIDLCKQNLIVIQEETRY